MVGSLEPAQVQQVMERQAEMIRSGQTKLCQKLQYVLSCVLCRYLSDRCELLSKKLQDLSSELGRKESFSGMAPYQHRLNPNFTH